MVHPDFTKAFIIDTDASQVALGAVCSQLDDKGTEHPIAYASRTLSPAERNYPATKRECLGVYWGVCKAFRQYTYGAPFVLRTDHSALTTIYGKGDAPERMMAGWQMALSAYIYDIQHRAGKEHDPETSRGNRIKTRGVKNSTELLQRELSSGKRAITKKRGATSTRTRPSNQRIKRLPIGKSDC